MTAENDVFRPLTFNEIVPGLLSAFDRTQEVTRCYRREGGAWVIRDITFTERWGESELAQRESEMRDILRSGGDVIGYFHDGELKGFASLEGALIGVNRDQAVLDNMQVSRELRMRGAGKRLFQLACARAKARGARKLYFSAHSSVESQAFYLKMGCVDASEPDRRHVELEPCDRQMEYVL